MKCLKLNALAKNALSEREMNSLSGGNACGCACRYVSTADNGNANHAGNKNSKDASITEMTFFLDEVVVTAE